MQKYNTQIKILIVASWYPSKKNPVSGIFVHEQIKTLSTKYDLDVIVPEYRFVKFSLFLKNLFKVSIQHEIYEEINIFRVPIYIGGGRFGKLLAITSTTYLKLHFLLLKKLWEKPNIIHSHVVLPGGVIGLRIANKYNVPFVLTEHSGPFSVHLATHEQKYLVKRVLIKANKVLSVSPALQRTMNEFLPKLDVSVVGNVVDTDFFVPKPQLKRGGKSNIVKFLFIALLNQDKGGDYLIKAASILKSKYPNRFNITIGGDGPAFHNLNRMTYELGVDDICKFTGLLSRYEVRKEMQTCDVFVLPSLGETFSMVICEAMACGKPVIATKCGGPEFIVTTENGILVEKENPKSLGVAMGKFIESSVSFDPDIVRQSIQSRFGKDAILKKISDVYEEIL